ncbi:hypothetical protein B0H13DRAFT_2380487 [Mycena leptocephala]|nr:hypothetical protein B0H13DRAFT_2380487 [Mycena leptocephala]
MGTITKARAEKRCTIFIDLAIGHGIPLLQIPLRASLYSASILKLTPTQNKISKATATTSSKTSAASVRPTKLQSLIKSFYRSHAQLWLLLSTSANRYIRLIALASTDLFITVPLATFVLYSNIAITGLSPWVSWADTHTLRAWRSCDEAIKNYRGVFSSVARRVGYSTAGSGLSSTGSQHPNSPLHLPWLLKRDSFDSFSDMSASYRGILPLEYDTEKARMEYDAEKAGTLTLGDVSGMLTYYKASDYLSSPTSSSASSDTDSDTEGIEMSAPRARAYPHPAGASAHAEE